MDTTCKVFACGGKLDFNNPITLHSGCNGAGSWQAVACALCGRVHQKDGIPVHNRPGDLIIYSEGGIVHRQVPSLLIVTFANKTAALGHDWNKGITCVEVLDVSQFDFTLKKSGPSAHLNFFAPRLYWGFRPGRWLPKAEIARGYLLKP